MNKNPAFAGASFPSPKQALNPSTTLPYLATGRTLNFVDLIHVVYDREFELFGARLLEQKSF